MRYLSICSGIEAASAAWEPLGMVPVAFSEVEPFPSAVLEHRFPSVSNLGDMTQYRGWGIEPGSIDVLVGGTPCQSFSVAGLRGGLDDERGNLALVYCRILERVKPQWFVWENVPGVLSSNGGRDFGSILGAMAELGYGVAYRVLDAQYVGVPQRRRRVFVVGCLGDWRSAAEVLFERGCLRRDTSKGGKKRKDVAGSLASRTSAGGGLGTDFDLDGGLQVVGPLMGGGTLNGHGTAGINNQMVQAGHILAVGPAAQVASTGQTARCLNAGGMGRQDYETETMVAERFGVRRLTPTECERLQGFPDGWTDVPYRGKPACDGPRYKAIGNSMAVPVMRWIGERMLSVEKKTPNTDGVEPFRY